MGNFISTTNLPNNVEVSEVSLNNTSDIINSKDMNENNNLDIPVYKKNIDIKNKSDYAVSLDSDYDLNSIETEKFDQITNINKYDIHDSNIDDKNINNNYSIGKNDIDEDDIDDVNLDNEFREAVYEYFKNKKKKELLLNKQKYQENLDNIGVYSTYSVEFGTKSKTRRIIENLI